MACPPHEATAVGGSTESNRTVTGIIADIHAIEQFRLGAGRDDNSTTVPAPFYATDGQIAEVNWAAAGVGQRFTRLFQRPEH
jgi:hypothetical protein